MALAQVLGLSLGMFVPPSLRKKSTAEVAWVYALFEQILLFKLSLNIKKHQKIAFFLKADTYSLERFGQHQEVFKTLLNIQELTFLRLHEAELAGYQQDMYQSMVIGVKLLKTENKKKVSLADLESQYAQQLEYVKYLRTLVADLSSSVGESEQLTKKKQELDEVK
jgi:valyl-tRNA synthetase